MKRAKGPALAPTKPDGSMDLSGICESFGCGIDAAPRGTNYEGPYFCAFHLLERERAAIAAWLKRAAPSPAGLVDVVHLAEVIEGGGRE